MTLNAILHYSAACFCAGVVCYALLRERRSSVHWLFGLGMFVLACEAFLTGLSIQSWNAEHAIFWQQWRMLAAALVPGVWLLFALSFTREEGQPLQVHWKWIVGGICLLHLVFVSLWWPDVSRQEPLELAEGWAFALGWAGYGFYLSFLLSAVLIIMILERILRASRGYKRWQVKFFVFGIGGFLAARVYTASHALVFHHLNLEFEIINAAALLTANLLMLISLWRAGRLHVDIYPSHKMLYNSLTLIIVGLYFLAIGLSVQTLNRFLSLQLQALIIFAALLGLVLILFSDRLRLRIKRLISRHLRRPHYDYRKVWKELTSRTTALVEERPLCEAVAQIISEMFDILSVSIWLFNAGQDKLRCGASTAFSPGAAGSPDQEPHGAAEILRSLNEQSKILDFEDPQTQRATGLTPAQIKKLDEARIRYVVPLSGDSGLLGFISLGDCVRYRSLSFETLDLLQSIADHVAAALLNAKLAERLRKARELEAFQNIAAFFVHDLKNLASKFSLMFKNLQVHFDNPAFRDDALRLMFQSVAQIDGMCSRLSSLREKIEIRPVETDLNKVAAAALAGNNGLPEGCLVENLQPVPMVCADPEQIQKVLTNLIINASDAVGNDGEIRVTTGTRDGWVELAVRDTGCGMSKEYMEQCLFRPFKTTKPQGTGIGLFQCKMIVEAHNGVIEVESQEGQGSTFRVLLPVEGPGGCGMRNSECGIRKD